MGSATEVGEAIKNSLYSAFGYAGSSTAHRAMLHVFRIAMVLTIWNAYESKHDLASSATIEETRRRSARRSL